MNVAIELATALRNATNDPPGSNARILLGEINRLGEELRVCDEARQRAELAEIRLTADLQEMRDRIQCERVGQGRTP
jgi:hypothetical protein